MNIEIGGLYSIPEDKQHWPKMHIKVIRKSEFYKDSVVTLDLKTGKEDSFHKSWLEPLPKELAGFSEEELKLYLRL